MTDVLPRLEGAFDGSDRKTLDRRQLLKAGAWAAPVIVLATAAPAAATSPLRATLVWNGFPGAYRTWAGKSTAGYYVQFQIGNSYTNDRVTVNGLTVTLTVPSDLVGTATPYFTSQNASRWSVTSVGADVEGKRVITLSYSGSLTANPSQNTGGTVLQVPLASVPSSGGSISMSAWATNSNTISAATSIS